MSLDGVGNLTKDQKDAVESIINATDGRVLKSDDGKVADSSLVDSDPSMLVAEKSLEVPPSSIFGGNQVVSFGFERLNLTNTPLNVFGTVATQNQGSTSFNKIQQFYTNNTREVVLQPLKDETFSGVLVFGFYQTPNPAEPTALGTIDEFYTIESSVDTDDISFDLYYADPSKPPLTTEEEIIAEYGRPMISERNLSAIANTESNLPLVNRPSFSTLQFFYAVAKGSAVWKGKTLSIPVGGTTQNYFIPFLKGTGVDVLSMHNVLDESFFSFGSMFENNPTGTTIPNAITYKGWVSATAGSFDNNNIVTFEENATADRLVIGENGAGVYEIHFHLSITNSGNKTTTGAVHINDVEQICAATSESGFNSKPNSMSASGYIALSANDYLDLRVKSETNDNIDVLFAQLSVKRISYL